MILLTASDHGGQNVISLNAICMLFDLAMRDATHRFAAWDGNG